MSTITLKTGEVIPQAIFEDIMAKLTELDLIRPNEFCRLVKACRNPDFEVKLCIWTAEKCRANNHTDCMNVEPYLGTIKSLNDQAHAEIDPLVRAIVLAGTPAIQLPRLMSPLTQA